MLTHLTIQNFVLIDKLDLSFDKGLTVFTGETGAGKSILLDALSLVLGARSENRFVRKGTSQAVLSATFHLNKNHPVHTLLAEQGLESEEDLILRRTLTSDGKSKSFINDQPVGLSLLKTVGEQLVEVHGQFATHGLLNPATHRLTLDTYGNLEKELHDLQKAWKIWQERKKERQELENVLAQKKDDETYLKESVDELIKLNPKAEEEEYLKQRRTKLMNVEKLAEILKTVQSYTDEEDRGTIALVTHIRSYLEQAEHLAESEIKPLLKGIEEVDDLLQDLSKNVEHLLAEMENENDLGLIDDRLFALRDIARKHHVEINELPELTQKLQAELNQIEHGEDKRIDLMHQEECARLTYLDVAKNLSKKRLSAAEKLEKSVSKELPALKLEKACFKVDVKHLEENEASENGLDQITFLITTNKGTDLMPLHKCASGGELSRFMLALKVNLNQTNGLTLIFDEIDTGISGATASAIGERLACLGTTHQTLVITHSPQVAGCGKHHYLVTKKEQEETTVTSVEKLSLAERVEEIARLLSGKNITDSARTTAKELLK